MNVITYLVEDENKIENRLRNLLDHYLDWTRDHCFEEIKKIINSLGIHIRKKETLLTSNLKDSSGLEPIIEHSKADRKAIDDEIDNLTQLHVDEPGFKKGLANLLNVVTEHNRFCEKEFYPQLESRLSSDDLEHISEQLEQIVLS